MTSESTQAGGTTVFSCALECCGKLQQAFPNDERLRSIIVQLEHWVDTQSGAKPAARPRRRARIDARDLRPLSEEVAALVHKAAVRAEQLHLS